LVKALDALDEVIALIRASANVDVARAGLIELLDVDDIQAQAILDMQLRRLAALERQRIVDDLAKIEAEIADLEDILAKPERQRKIVRDELAELAEKYGDDRRTRIIPADGDVADEDLIAREEVVVTITETGYAKRTKSDLYRSQKRGGKGVQGAGLKQDDIVKHFFVGSTHDWILFFTTQGRVYRAKAYELPEASRTARGQHVANLLAFQPEERIAQVIQIKSYEDAPYLVLATKNGLVKKSKLTDFDSNRSGGIVAVNLRDGDELVGAVLCSADNDLLLVSANGQSIRFSATDEALRPMGRATSGVQGMRFNDDDQLLSLNVVNAGRERMIHDLQHRIGKTRDGQIVRRPRGMTARSMRDKLEREIPLLRHRHESHGLLHTRERLVQDRATLVQYPGEMDMTPRKNLRDIAITFAAADFFVLSEGEHDGALRRKAGSRKPLRGVQQGDKAAFVVDRAAAPDEAVGNVAGEWIVRPISGCSGHDRHNVHMRHQQDGLGAGVLALPGEQEALADDLPCRGAMERGIGLLHPCTQGIKLGVLGILMGAIAIGDRLEADRGSEVSCHIHGIDADRRRRADQWRWSGNHRGAHEYNGDNQNNRGNDAK